MERKIELRDIAGYLPYDLKCITYHNSIVPAGLSVDIKTGKLGFYDDLTPILRPLSDLYKTITHNGKEIIPIVECAGIAFPHLDRYKILYEDTGGVRLVFNQVLGYPETLDREKYEFMLRDNGFWCRVYNTDRYCFVENQYQLFDYLHELKIDYRGLIENKIAISCYDLSENPYE